MLLSPFELELLLTLHTTLMFYVNDRLNVASEEVSTPAELAGLPLTVRLEIRDALNSHLELIDEFVEENPANFPDDQLDIVRSWNHLVHGNFFILKELKKHTVFLSMGPPVVAYGVVGLSQPFRDFVGPSLPAYVKAVLLPFRDKIVFDGLMTGYGVTFGPEIRNELKEEFKKVQASGGIVTSLPMADSPVPAKKPKRKSAAKAAKKAGEVRGSEKDDAVAAVVGMVDQFCATHLNEEYAMVCRKLAEKLARKRPSPLLQGKPNAWASGIIRAIGGANFLHDKTQKPYMRSTDIDRALGTSPSSGAVKLAAIREMFGVFRHDPEWMLPSRLEDSPLVWMLKVNGIMMDIRDAPREAQEVAFEQGLIPYIPADRE